MGVITFHVHSVTKELIASTTCVTFTTSIMNAPLNFDLRAELLAKILIHSLPCLKGLKIYLLLLRF